MRIIFLFCLLIRFQFRKWWIIMTHIVLSLDGSEHIQISVQHMALTHEFLTLSTTPYYRYNDDSSSYLGYSPFSVQDMMIKIWCYSQMKLVTVVYQGHYLPIYRNKTKKKTGLSFVPTSQILILTKKIISIIFRCH